MEMLIEIRPIIFTPKMAHLIDAEVEKLAKAAPSMSRSDLLAAFYSTPEGKEAYTLYDRARRQAAR